VSKRPWIALLREKMRDWHDMDDLARDGNTFAVMHRDMQEQEIVAMIVERIKAKETPDEV